MMTETTDHYTGHGSLHLNMYANMHGQTHSQPTPGWRAINTRPVVAFTFAFRVLLALLITACASAPPTTVASNAQPPGPTTVEVPVIIEVTRETVTEHIVEVTPSPPVACAPATIGEAQEIIIAAIVPLSQANALSNAVAAQTAVVLAVDDLNAAGGINGTPVHIWWGDSANDPARTQALAEAAIVEHCAVAIIGANDNAAAAALDIVARRHGVPHLILNASDDALTASQSPVAFRLTPSNSMLSTAYAEWVAAVDDYNGDGSVNAMLIVENSEAGLMRADLLRVAMQARDIGVDIYPVDLPASDFSSLIARIVVKESMPDVIFIRFNGEIAQLLHMQLLQNGIGPDKASLIVTMRRSAELGEFWQQMGDAGVYTVVDRIGPWRTTVGDEATSLVNSYLALFDRWPEATAFGAYDALFLIADAIQRADSLAPAALVKSLEASDITLAAGHYTFPGPPTTQRGTESAASDAWQWHQWQGMPLIFLQYTVPNQSLTDAEVLWPSPFATIRTAYLRSND